MFRCTASEITGKISIIYVKIWEYNYPNFYCCETNIFGISLGSVAGGNVTWTHVIFEPQVWSGKLNLETGITTNCDTLP
jgi:hypothetical protein